MKTTKNKFTKKFVAYKYQGIIIQCKCPAPKVARPGRKVTTEINRDRESKKIEFTERKYIMQKEESGLKPQILENAKADRCSK